MPVQMELWQLIVLLLSFFAALWQFGRVLLKQFNKNLDERYAAQETARKEGQHRWQEEFRRIEHKNQMLEQQFNRLSISLPLEYVRREDWVRFSNVIDSKLDKIYTMIERIKGETS